MTRLSSFFNDTATTEIYTLPRHDALPISEHEAAVCVRPHRQLGQEARLADARLAEHHKRARRAARSEEHTSELQSRQYLVCRLLLAKKNKSSVRNKRDLSSSPPPSTITRR